MALFDFLKPKQPADLRSALFSAIAKQDAKSLSRLCAEHEEEILRSFPTWTKVPLEIRDDPGAMQHYANGLIGLAVHFMNDRGRPELMQRLQGSGPEDNPATAWVEALQEAQRLKEELRFAEGVELLSNVLIDIRKLQGTAVEHYLPRTFGLLGDLHFQSGSIDNAIASTQQALKAVELAGDEEGVQAYLGNLYEFHRFAGRGPEAAVFAERLAALPGPEAGWFAAQARILREGEPLNRVIVSVEGRRMELEDAELVGQLGFSFQRNRLGLFAADVWSQRGMALGGEGKFEEALDAFKCAAEADPHHPNPHYQAGVTFLYLERYFEAVAAYEETERLAPGWFQCRADAWLANEAAQGRLPHSLLLLVLQLVDGGPPTRAALRQVESAAEQAPHVPVLDLIAARLHSALGRPKRALASLRAGLDKAGDDDTRTRLLVDLAIATEGDAKAKEELLKEAVALKGNLVAAATATLILKSL